jgi:hypothetical protein
LAYFDAENGKDFLLKIMLARTLNLQYAAFFVPA